MLNGEVIVSTLKELIRKADSTDKSLGLHDAAEAAHRRMICGGEFPTELVSYALVVGLRTRKPRLSETCLSCAFHILQSKAVPPSCAISSTWATDGHGGSLKGTPVVNALVHGFCDSLTGVSDGSVQLKALDCISVCVLDEQFTSLTGGILSRMLQSCFNLSLTSANTAVQISSSGVLRQLVAQRIVRRFLTQGEVVPSPPHFACPTELDFANDYDPSDNYTEMQLPYRLEDISPQQVNQATLNDMSPANRDLFLLLRNMFALSTAVIPTEVVSTQAVEVQTRLQALKILRLIFSELPAMNSNAECAASSSFAMIISLLKMDLWKSIARNVATIMPSQLFDLAIEIMSELAVKMHYHIHAELHLFLCTVVLPIVQSRFSTFQQKLSVLAMVRQILVRPSVIVAYFINYDCNIKFEESGCYGGLLEVLLDFVLEMAYLDFTAKEWFTEDQGVLLRNECIKIYRHFTSSLHRWITEDPNATEAVGGPSDRLTSLTNPALATAIPIEGAEFLDSEDDDENPSTHGSLYSASYRSAGGVASMPPYHWKHIHQMLCNKNICEAAISRFNTNWRHGRKFLEDRKVIPTGDLVAFTRFLRESPSIEKTQICGIFEKVLKDQTSYDILRAYLKTFSYVGIPLDIALRDTTCEFMSWDSMNFEAPVWGKIQEAFGDEYSLQNADRPEGDPCRLSPRDADALAGVCLFLHTSLHNRNVGADRMALESFINFGGPCLEQQLPEHEMEAIYLRIQSKKWVPERKLVKVSVMTSADLSQLGGAHDAPTRSRGIKVKISDPESELLEGNMKTYTDNLHHLRITQQNQLSYIRVANEHLRVFENELTALYSKKRMQLPYVLPRYAQHVRPLLLTFYPHIISCMYVALRLAVHEPILHLVDEVYEMVFDIAAAFVINLADLSTAVEKITQKCLRQDSAVGLGQLSASLCPFFMNRV